MRVESIAPRFGERQAAFVAAKVDAGDKALGAELAEGIVVGVEVLFGHHSERADGGQRAAVLAVQLVDPVAISHLLAVRTVRQVEVVHQAVARILIIALAVLAPIVPSSVRHRPS